MATKVKLIADNAITTTQIDTSSLDSHFSGGTGVTYSSGEISIGQAVHSTDSPTFADLTLTGNLNITGDLNSYNVTDLDVTDQTITLGAGQTEELSGGSGIIVDGSGASILWDETNTEWDFNNNLHISKTSGAAVLKVDTSGTADAGIQIKGYDAYVGLGDATNGLQWYVWNDGPSSSSSLKFGSEALSGSAWYADASQAMVITSSGDVGIGNTAPAYKLDVSGGIRIDGGFALTNNAYFIGSASYGFRFNNYGDTENNVIMYNNGNMWVRGNIGIGNTSPTSNLTIGSSQSDGLEFTYDSTNTYRNRISNYWNSSSDTRMDFEIGRTGGVAPTALLSVGYNSKVGIGTTTPSKKLHIYGDHASEGSIGLLVENTNGSSWIQQKGSASSHQIGSTSDGYKLYSDTTSKYLMRMQDDGSFHIGNDISLSNSSWQFNIVGSDGRSLELEPAYGGSSAFLQTYNRQTSSYTDMYYYSNLHNFYCYNGSAAELTFNINSATSGLPAATIQKNAYSSNQRMLVINHGTAHNGTSYDTVVVNQYDVPCIRLRETQYGIESTWATGNENTNASVLGASHRLAFTTGNGAGNPGYVNSNERMQIDASGHVSIGTTAAYPGVVNTGNVLSVRGPLMSGRPKGHDASGGYEPSNEPRCIRDWFVYAGPSTNPSAFLHMKTNLWAGGSPNGNIDFTMSLFRYRAYSYGGGVASGMIGWHNWVGGFYNVGVHNDTSWAVVQSSYTSTDGYVVLVAYLAASYCHLAIDWDQWGGYSFRERKVTAVDHHSSATGKY